MSSLTFAGCADGMPTTNVNRQPAHPDVSPTPAEPIVCTVDDIQTTILPAASDGDVEVLCTSCDIGGCDGLGEPCGEYGSPCNANGADGICIACCDGAIGELHCKPVVY